MPMSSKSMLLAITALAVFTFTTAAQDKAAAGALDSAFVGKSIFSLLPSKAKGDPADVKVHQSQAILESFNSHISSNSSKGISGFRIRIFNDNQQSARVSSEAAEKRFQAMCPGIPTYRTYSNPYFKVVAGDFRTKSEALKVLQTVRAAFPGAIIVKESINYPAVGKRPAGD